MARHTLFVWIMLISGCGFSQGHISLDGVDDVLISNDTLLPSGDFTFECFLQVCDSSNTQDMPLISTGQLQWVVKPDTNGNAALMVFHHSYGRTIFLNPVQQNQWTHFAFTYRSVDSTIRVFFNGLFVDTYQRSITRTKGFVIGDSSHSFQGKIDELRVSQGILYHIAGISPYSPLVKTPASYTLFNFNDTFSLSFRDAVAQKELKMLNGSVFQPLASVSMDSVLCAGTTIRLVAKGGHNFYWQPDTNIPVFDLQGGSQNVKGTAVFAHVKDTGTVTCRMVDTNTCETTVKQLITPLPQPVFSLGGDTSFCASDSFSIDIIGYKRYVWSDGDSASKNTIHQSGWYWLEVTDSNSCTYRDSLRATAIPSPVVNLGNDTILEAGHTMYLDAGPGYASYRWSTAETTQRILITLSKEYFVTVTDTNGCQGFDQIVVYINDVSTEEFTNEYIFNLYPNPAAHTFFISHNENKKYTIQITDLQGAILLSKTTSSKQVEIDIEGWPKGTYLVTLQSEHGRENKRLMIE